MLAHISSLLWAYRCGQADVYACMELKNAPVLNAFQLFLPSLIFKAAEESVSALHDEAFCKVVI